MRKRGWMVLLLLITALLLAACGGKGNPSVDEANEQHDPGKQRLEEGNIQAVMDNTKKQFSREDVTFLTYRIRDGLLKVNMRIHDETKNDEIIRALIDAFTGTEANQLEVEVKDKGVYEIPLDQDTSDLEAFFTPAE